MFDKFGIMDNEGINILAENLFNEGDLDSLRELAKENGIEPELAELYIAGEIPQLCDPLTGALGKIDIEAAALKPKGILEDWVEYIRSQCMVNDEMPLCVRKPDKTLKGCIAALLKWSFANQWTVDRDIIKAAGVSAGRVTLGIPGMGRAKKIIRQYYMEG